MISQGDALTVLKGMKSESVNCVVTSPPYWALRDYGVEGQLGLESTFKEYISKLCDIFDEVKRVLRKDGTCWVNLGDTYYTKSGSGFKEDNITGNRAETHYGLTKANELRGKGLLPSKNLTLVPFRFAIEMQNRRWILRNVIIWHKPNCMPSSVKDRFTVDFEYVFFFVKNKKYWFETQREPHNPDSIKRACRARVSRKLDAKQYAHSRTNKNTGYKEMKERFESGELSHAVHPQGRNKRCVWRITTKSFKEAHFAVFPEELVETPIKAGCPKGGIVLDPFCGSGTTGVVAQKLGRKFTGIELNPEYIKIAEKRLEENKTLYDI